VVPPAGSAPGSARS